MPRLLAVAVVLALIAGGMPASPVQASCGSCCERATAAVPDDGVPPCCRVESDRPDERARLATGHDGADQPGQVIAVTVPTARWFTAHAAPPLSDAHVHHMRRAVLRN